MERYDLENIAAAFADSDNAYSANIDDFDYSQLQAHECHDYEELREMRQGSGYDPALCRVVTMVAAGRVKRATAFVVVTSDHGQEWLRVVRAGYSQAPPAWICEANDDVAPLMVGRAA